MRDKIGMNVQNPSLVALGILHTEILLYFLWCVFKKKK